MKSALFAIAKKSGNTTACLKLINRGYDAKEMKHEYLRWAHELGMFKTAFILLEAGGQIALTQEEKNEYLRNAILSSRSKAALILLDQITHVNAQDNDLNTFLHLACKKELVDVVEKLIHKGADKTLKNIKGHTLLDIAAKRQHAPLLALLNGRA